MGKERPARLYFVGERDPHTGQALEYFGEVPARDLEPEDMANLSDEQVARITSAPEGRRPLYQVTKPAGRDEKPKAPEPAPAAEPKAEPAKGGGG